jgi:tetratricopeptide (TPR) repeat protein
MMQSMRAAACLIALAFLGAATPELEKARNLQDLAAIEKLVPSLATAAQRESNNATAQYRLALAKLYLAEVALELRDKNAAATAAEAGIAAAQRATQLDPSRAEYHRVLGALCGQIIPANVLAGIRYGKCALEAVNKAIELDPKSAEAWMSRGVGNYYLPPQFGGGTDKAIQDLQKALQLNPKLADAHLWLGIVLRKANRNGEARAALSRSLELNPQRVWARQQLERTPAQ